MHRSPVLTKLSHMASVCSHFENGRPFWRFIRSASTEIIDFCAELSPRLARRHVRRVVKTGAAQVESTAVTMAAFYFAEPRPRPLVLCMLTAWYGWLGHLMACSPSLTSVFTPVLVLLWSQECLLGKKGRLLSLIHSPLSLSMLHFLFPLSLPLSFSLVWSLNLFLSFPLKCRTIMQWITPSPPSTYSLFSLRGCTSLFISPFLFSVCDRSCISESAQVALLYNVPAEEEGGGTHYSCFQNHRSLSVSFACARQHTRARVRPH